MLLIARVTIAGRDCISWEQNASRAMRQSCSRYVPAVLEIGTLKLLFELSIIVEIHTCWKYHFRENRRTCESVKFVKEERQEFAQALKSELRYAEKLQLFIRFYGVSCVSCFPAIMFINCTYSSKSRPRLKRLKIQIINFTIAVNTHDTLSLDVALSFRSRY